MCVHKNWVIVLFRGISSQSKLYPDCLAQPSHTEPLTCRQAQNVDQCVCTFAPNKQKKYIIIIMIVIDIDQP